MDNWVTENGKWKKEGDRIGKWGMGDETVESDQMVT